MLLISMAAPFVAYATYEWLQKREIDEHKLIPLFVAVGSVGHPAGRRPQLGHGRAAATSA